MKCRLCGSYAVNHHLYDRDGTKSDLCDVHYWKEKAGRYSGTLEQIKLYHEHLHGDKAKTFIAYDMAAKGLAEEE